MAVPLDERAAPVLLPSYLAPAAELVVAGFQPPPAGTVAVCGPWSSLVLSALEAAAPPARCVLMESNPSGAVLQATRTAWPRMHGRALPSPLRSQSLQGLIHGLALWDQVTDATALRECARVLKPGGLFAAAFLVRGSFEAFFQTARQACEVLELPEGVNALDGAEAQFRHPDTLRSTATRAGFADVELGLEERAVAFAGGRDFVADKAVQNLVLRHLALADGAARTQLLELVARSLDAAGDGGVLHVRVVTGVLRAVRLPD